MISNGEVDRFKARLVIRGFSQQYGLNYFETFSPVVRFTSIRAILAMDAAEKMTLRQFDVKTAFLHGELEEEIYMKQPRGYDDNSGRVCKLLKSLYGLKQASRCWNKKFKFIFEFKFAASKADPCVFIHENRGKRTILALYIDDGLLASGDDVFVEAIEHHMKSEFEVEFTDVDMYLGIQVKRKSDGSIFIHQSNYVHKILKRFNMEDCKKVAIPADPNQVLHNQDGSLDTDFPYREAVGSLMYLSVATRPDISFILGCVSRYLEKPKKIHVNAVKRIFKYLSGTAEHGIFFKSNNNLNFMVTVTRIMPVI